MHSMPDGSLGTNMRGNALCSGFQSGQCTHTQPNSLVCAVTGQMHQCSRCLSGEHGSKFPQPCTRDQKAPKAFQRGKEGYQSKGKGKGKGKW